MGHYVYVIECLLDGKKYVGYSHDPNNRWLDHQASSRRKRSRGHLHRAMAKHGIENFKFDVVEECTSIEEGYSREIFWISQLNTFGCNGYNMTLGGDGCRGYIATDEVRRKNSESRRGKSPWNKGKKIGSTGFKHTVETKRTMSDKKRGTVFSIEHKEKLREAWTPERRKTASERMHKNNPMKVKHSVK